MHDDRPSFAPGPGYAVDPAWSPHPPPTADQSWTAPLGSHPVTQAPALGPPPTAYPPVTVVMPPTRSSGTALGVAGLVVGGLALLGSWEPTTGTLAPQSGGGITGDALAAEISRKVRDEGSYPEDFRCPATARVQQDVTTVCHGRVDGDPWAFVMFFEDAHGGCTLLEL